MRHHALRTNRNNLWLYFQQTKPKSFAMTTFPIGYMTTWTIWKIIFSQKCNNSPLLIPFLGTFLLVSVQDQDGLEQVWQNSLSATEPYCMPRERVVCQSPHYPLHLPEYPVPSLTKEWLRKQAERKNFKAYTFATIHIYYTMNSEYDLPKRAVSENNNRWELQKVLRKSIYLVVK